MDRRTFLASLGATLGGSAAGRSVRGKGSFRTRAQEEDGGGRAGRYYRNPVHGRVFPDPTVLRVGSTYYAYATYHDWGSGPSRPLIPILRSGNLVDWEFAGPAFERKPDWRDGDGYGLWAPSAGRLAGRYVLYYSLARFGDPNPGIGVATADSPTGPFEDRGELLRSEGVGVPNSIDPCLLVDDGTPHLFWGSHRGLYGIELAPDGLSLAGEKFRVAGDGVEAPYVLRRDGRYYLFGSRGRCCAGAESTYRVVVGRSDSLRGPYRNRAGESLLDAAGSVVVRGSERFAGPGHNAVARDDAGNEWLVYHAYERGNPWIGETPRRVLVLDRLRWRRGWPLVEGRTPSVRAHRPVSREQGVVPPRTDDHKAD